MKVTQDDIIKLIEGKCNAVDAKAIIDALEHDDELVPHYFTEQEWNGFVADQKLDAATLDNSLKFIRSEAYQKARVYKSRIFYLSAAAAAVILFVFIGYYLWKSGNSNTEKLQQDIAVTAVDLIKDTNATSIKKYIYLEDSSTITLEPNSAVTYLKHFPNDRRIIELKGTAFFEVAKDRNRPFEVQSAGFSTIALGTSFRVTDIPENKSVTVQLYTGKVLVKQSNNSTVFKNVVLFPNQQLVINTSSFLSKMSVISAVDANKDMVKKGREANNIIWGDYITATQLQFDNTALIDIVKVLEHHYNITIKYSNKELAGIVFTGTFKKTEDVKNVLATIASVNKLNLFTSDGSHFKIAR